MHLRVCARGLPSSAPVPHLAGCWLAGLVALHLEFTLTNESTFCFKVFIWFEFREACFGQIIKCLRYFDLIFVKKLQILSILSSNLVCILDHVFPLRSPAWLPRTQRSSRSTLETFMEFCFLIACCLFLCIFMAFPHKLCQPVRSASSPGQPFSQARLCNASSRKSSLIRRGS